MKHFIIFLIVYLGTQGESLCQQTPCTVDGYRKLVGLNEDTLRILNQLKLKDGGQLLTGILTKVGSINSEGIIIKTDNAANVIWEREITDPQAGESLVLSLAAESQTGNYIIGGYSIPSSTTNGSCYILSCTASGTIIWQKQYPIAAMLGQSLSPYLTSLNEDEIGNIYVTGALTATIVAGPAGQYPFIIKTDNNGQLLFNKLYHATKVGLNYFMGLFPLQNRILIWGYGEDDNTVSVDIRRIYWMTLDNNGMNLMDGRGICFTAFSGVGSYAIKPNFLKVFKTDSGFSVCGLLGENISANRAIVNLAFDNTLSLRHSWFLPTMTNIIPYNTGDFSIDNEGSVLLAQRSTATQLYVSKFDVSGSLVQQRQLNGLGTNTNRNPIYGGVRIGAVDGVISSINNYINGRIPVCEISHFQLNINSECFGNFTKYGSAQSFSTYTLPITKLDAMDDIVSQQNSSFAISSPPTNDELLCSAQSVCNSLTLTGNDTVCISAGQPSIYTAHRNQSCSTPIKWQFDTSGTSNFEKLNDSALSITWKITVLATRTTQVIATLDNCSSLSDKVTVFITPYVGPFQKDTTICTGDSIRLSPGNWFKKYIWQDGSADSVLFAKQPGVYYVSYQTFCGRTFSDTVHIASPNSNLLSNGLVSLCKGDSAIIKANDGLTDYQWTPDYFRNSINEQSILVFPPKDTAYVVSALLQSGCRISDTAKVLVLDRAEVSISADYHLCGIVTLSTKSDDNLSEILWSGPSTNATANSIQVIVGGSYQIVAIDNNNCKVSDTLNVQVRPCELTNYQIHFPNAFTPNEDGKNDIFKPIITGSIISYELKVYNNLGQRIFISRDPYAGWDGKIAGKAQQSSAYVWICNYQFQGRQNEISKGTLLLIR